MNSILAQVHKSALKFLTHVSEEKTFETISKEARNIVGAEYGSVFLDGKGKLERVYANSDSIAQIKIKKRGFVYKCYKTGRSLVVTPKEVRILNKKLVRLGIKSIVLFPLIYQQKTIGVLSVLSKIEKKFNKEELECLNIFGSFASLAIVKTKLLEEKKEVQAEKEKFQTMESILEKIHSSALKFLVPLNTEEIYKVVVDEAINLVEAKFGSLLLDVGGELKRVYTTLPIASQIKIRSRGFTYRTFRYGKPLIKISKNFANTKLVWKLGLQSNIFIPLSYENEALGVLIMNSKDNVKFTNRELEVLKLYGSLASLAIKKNKLYADVVQALESRDLFLSMAAHELRTPLTTIDGYVQLLNRKFKDNNLNEAKWIGELKWETFRMTQLINEMLTFNKIQSGKLNYDLKECNFKELVDKALLSVRLIHPNHKIITNDFSGDNVLIIGDGDQIQQVLINLFDNAAKFSDFDDEIIINLKTKSPYIYLTIKDKGRGIPKKDLPNIFNGYYIGKNHTVEGMGLGLYLAKNVIEYHRGTINISSKLNQGTKVQVKIPKVKI